MNLVCTTNVSEFTVLRPGSSEKSIHIAQPDFSSITFGARSSSDEHSVSEIPLKKFFLERFKFLKK